MNIEGERPNISDVLNRHNKRTGIPIHLDDIMPILRKHGRRWKREFAIATPRHGVFWFYQWQWSHSGGRIRSWQTDDEKFMLDEELLKQKKRRANLGNVHSGLVSALFRRVRLSVMPHRARKEIEYV